MNKLDDYNIPDTDKECWDRYPKFNWVYNRTKLFDAQHMPWQPFQGNNFSQELDTFTIEHNGCIYVPDSEELHLAPLHTEAIVQTGELKWFSHVIDSVFTEEVIGEVDLRINAFVTLYLQKFTGAVSFRTRSNHIYEITLSPTKSLLPIYPIVAIKLLKKVYKKKV